MVSRAAQPEESINFCPGPYAAPQNSLQIQPTIPFPVVADWLPIPGHENHMRTWRIEDKLTTQNEV
jgi:hypothetical protein